jgi:hypothetical protein
MKMQKTIPMLAGSLFVLGFAVTNYGFARTVAFDGRFELEACAAIVLGLALIVLSARTNRLLERLSALAHTTPRVRRKVAVTTGLLLMLSLPAQAQEPQPGFRIRNVEFGSTRLEDSDSEVFRMYFTSVELQIAGIEEAKLWLRQNGKRDRYGDERLRSFVLEVSPASWLSVSAGYAHMPVGSFRVGMNLGLVHLAVGAGREAVTARANAIADRIDERSVYADLSVRLPFEASFGATVGRSRFGDGNRLRTFTTGLSTSRSNGPFRLSLLVGYGVRELDRFSPYYWSPEVYREVYVAPDLGLETDAFWIYLSVSIDRILEERDRSNPLPQRNWGGNGEISVGINVGPGSVYLTGRYWNAGLQRAGSAYSGKILQASYKVNFGG